MLKGNSLSGGAAITLLLLPVLLVAVFFVSFVIGSYPISIETVFAIIAGKFISLPHYWTNDMETVVFKIRLPRIIAALLVGAALATSGAAYQGMFKNPMVSPGILGVSAGASLGAALAILLSYSNVGIQIGAFIGGMLAVTITYFISVWLGRNGDTILVMILTGIIVGILFSSFLSLIKYAADPYIKLPTITYWLMGSLASISIHDVEVASIPIVLGLAAVMLVRWNLNVMSFGEEEASALGVNTGRVRLVVILCATMMTASAVAISGMIGLVGLIVPHVARLLVGPDYKVLLPVAMLMGALFLLLVDNLARTLYSVEIPLGILTSMIGAPFFLYLLINTKKKGWA
ncbi:putative ABC transporter permease protein [Sporomusa silvacetica DSM 10669]|uniref:ABC transporter permease protein n=1 Tax=Sporomusa silvacetica DSM 10669 TaxID=1123289 RepID=A0ABZ3IVG1_9FIRM|nr:iron ABC transporter permease [Sporomusa silvacetica]OZC12965.1 putative ABC transporter permease protein [Sporomusa silvacetica DSM 10669]